MNPLPDVFVGNIGLSSITFCGKKCKQFLNLPCSRFVRESVVVECENEDDLILLIQSLVDKCIPFESTYKSDPARRAKLYKAEGRVSGVVVSFDWSAAGTTYSNN
jgi:hypothetical protein